MPTAPAALAAVLYHLTNRLAGLRLVVLCEGSTQPRKMSTQSRSLRLADQLSASPYAWPGGYPLFGVFSDGGCCCHKCAKTERESIGTTTGTDGWCLVAIEANWEDPALFCDHCGERVESAYAEAEQ